MHLFMIYLHVYFLYQYQEHIKNHKYISLPQVIARVPWVSLLLIGAEEKGGNNVRGGYPL